MVFNWFGLYMLMFVVILCESWVLLNILLFVFVFNISVIFKKRVEYWIFFVFVWFVLFIRICFWYLKFGKDVIDLRL